MMMLLLLMMMVTKCHAALTFSFTYQIPGQAHHGVSLTFVLSPLSSDLSPEVGELPSFSPSAPSQASSPWLEPFSSGEVLCRRRASENEWVHVHSYCISSPLIGMGHL